MTADVMMHVGVCVGVQDVRAHCKYWRDWGKGGRRDASGGRSSRVPGG